MELLSKLVEGLLKLLSHWVAYDYGATKKENQQLKENEKLKDKYEEIDNMDITANDAYTEWLRNSK